MYKKDSEKIKFSIKAVLRLEIKDSSKNLLILHPIGFINYCLIRTRYTYYTLVKHFFEKFPYKFSEQH